MFAPDSAAVVRTLAAEPGARNGLREADAFLESVGRTPLVHLARLARGTAAGSSVWGKAEFLNPTGSVKDRAALAIVRAALHERLLPERTLLDASSGNTAIAYAMLGARLGFRVELCLPANVRADRLARVKAYGARVVLTDPVEGTDGAQREARARSDREPGRYFYADQYNHPANPAAHLATTGPEIWEQSGGRVTHFVAGVGTGGTVSGVARFLRSVAPGVEVIGVEPDGPLHGIEGLKHLPTALRPGAYASGLVGRTVRVSTERATAMAGALAREEGLLVGRSSGAAVAVAVDLAKSRSDAFVVAILPDAGPLDLSEPPGGHRP